MDRVQVIKRESAALGGDNADEDDAPSPIDPQEDAIEAAGLFIQSVTARDEAVGLARDSSDRMVLHDAENITPVTLTQLLESIDFDNHVFNVLGGFVYTGDMVPVTRS